MPITSLFSLAGRYNGDTHHNHGATRLTLAWPKVFEPGLQYLYEVVRFSKTESYLFPHANAAYSSSRLESSIGLVTTNEVRLSNQIKFN